MLTEGVPLKYVSIMKALYSKGRVRAYGQLSECFRTSSGVCQGCPLKLSIQFCNGRRFRTITEELSCKFSECLRQNFIRSRVC